MKINPRIVGLIEGQARRKAHPVTIRDLVDTLYGSHLANWTRDQHLESCIKNANLLRAELKVRMAHRLYDLHRLPFEAVENPDLFHLYKLYSESFEKVVHVPPIQNENEEESFAQMLQQLLDSHTVVFSRIRGAIEAPSKIRYNDEPDISDRSQDAISSRTFGGIMRRQNSLGTRSRRYNIGDVFFIRLFASRIGMRVLAEHHLALRKYYKQNSIDDLRPGAVHLSLKPTQLILDAVYDIKRVNPDLTFPEVQITGDIKSKFTYIPEHVSFIVRSTIENSLQATVKTTPEGEPLPTVVVDIRKGEFDLCVKVTDRGGGMDRDIRKVTRLEERHPNGDICLGLAYSQLYARYFGGNLYLHSLQGHGTNVYVNLNHLGTSEELNFLCGRVERG